MISRRSILSMIGLGGAAAVLGAEAVRNVEWTGKMSTAVVHPKALANVDVEWTAHGGSDLANDNYPEISEEWTTVRPGVWRVQRFEGRRLLSERTVIADDVAAADGHDKA